MGGPDLPSFWEENLKTLETINRGLAAELANAPQGSVLYAVKPTPPGRYTCRIADSVACRPAFEHCPVTRDTGFGESAEWIHPPPRHPDQVPRLPERDLIGHNLFIVVRMGLGNEVLDLNQRLAALELLQDRNRRIVAIEDRVDLVRAALTLYDWRTLLGSTRFILLCGTNPHDLLARFFERYPFSALGRPVVCAGSGPVQASCALARTIGEAVETCASQQRLHASAVIESELQRRALRKRSHVRKVLWLVPGHNYLQTCCVNALREMGIAADLHLWTSSTYRFVKRFEWVRLLRHYDPDALILVNATPVTFFGGDEIDGLPVLVATWFVDNPQRFVRESRDLAAVDVVACFDGHYLPYLDALGAKHTLEVRTATGLFHRLNERHQPTGPSVTFVGELGTRGFWGGMDSLLSSSFPELHRAIHAAAEEYAKCPTIDLEEVYAHYIDTERFPFRGSVVDLVENNAAYHRRRQVLGAILDLGLVTYGDAEWGDPERAGPLANCWAGRRIDYFKELPAVYASSQININIFHPQCRLGLNPRVYDVLACGGFLLTTYNPGIADEFVDGEHLVTFRDSTELRQLVLYYRDRPEERRRIARAGQERVLAGCRYHDRMRRFFGMFDSVLAGESYVHPC
jgi:hypothetical protein